MQYEYKVIAAPTKGLKAPGVKGPEARFLNAVEHAINELAAEGWAYVRSDTLTSEERKGFTGTRTVQRTVLVFQRDAQQARGGWDAQPEAREQPAVAAPAPVAAPEPTPAPPMTRAVEPAPEPEVAYQPVGPAAEAEDPAEQRPVFTAMRRDHSARDPENT